MFSDTVNILLKDALSIPGYIFCQVTPYLNCLIIDLEEKAAPGFEPGNNGFADHRLATWLCRLNESDYN